MFGNSRVKGILLHNFEDQNEELNPVVRYLTLLNEIELIQDKYDSNVEVHFISSCNFPNLPFIDAINRMECKSFTQNIEFYSVIKDTRYKSIQREKVEQISGHIQRRSKQIGNKKLMIIIDDIKPLLDSLEQDQLHGTIIIDVLFNTIAEQDNLLLLFGCNATKTPQVFEMKSKQITVPWAFWFLRFCYYHNITGIDIDWYFRLPESYKLTSQLKKDKIDTIVQTYTFLDRRYLNNVDHIDQSFEFKFYNLYEHMKELDTITQWREHKLRDEITSMIALKYQSLRERSNYSISDDTDELIEPSIFYNKNQYREDESISNHRKKFRRHSSFSKSDNIIKYALRRKKIASNLNQKHTSNLKNLNSENFNTALEHITYFGQVIIKNKEVEVLIQNKLDLDESNIWLYPLLLVYTKLANLEKYKGNIHPYLDRVIDHGQIKNWLGKSDVPQYLMKFDAKRAISLCYTLARSTNIKHDKLGVKIEDLDAYLDSCDIVTIKIAHKPHPNIKEHDITLVKISIPGFPEITCGDLTVNRKYLVNSNNQFRLNGKFSLSSGMKFLKFKRYVILKTSLINFQLDEMIHTQFSTPVSPYTFHKLEVYHKRSNSLIAITHLNDKFDFQIK